MILFYLPKHVSTCKSEVLHSTPIGVVGRGKHFLFVLQNEQPDTFKHESQLVFVCLSHVSGGVPVRTPLMTALIITARRIKKLFI